MFSHGEVLRLQRSALVANLDIGKLSTAAWAEHLTDHRGQGAVAADVFKAGLVGVAAEVIASRQFDARCTGHMLGSLTLIFDRFHRIWIQCLLYSK